MYGTLFTLHTSPKRQNTLILLCDTRHAYRAFCWEVGGGGEVIGNFLKSELGVLGT